MGPRPLICCCPAVDVILNTFFFSCHLGPRYAMSRTQTQLFAAADGLHHRYGGSCEKLGLGTRLGTLIGRGRVEAAGSFNSFRSVFYSMDFFRKAYDTLGSEISKTFDSSKDQPDPDVSLKPGLSSRDQDVRANNICFKLQPYKLRHSSHKPSGLIHPTSRREQTMKTVGVSGALPPPRPRKQGNLKS